MAYIYHKKRLPDGTTKDVHRIVMQLYLKRKLTSDEVVHHINGDTRDDRLRNLQLMSRAEHTSLHYPDGGLPQPSPETRQIIAYKLRGERAWNARLKDKEAEEVLRLYRSGIGSRRISRMFRVSNTTVVDIGKRRRWKHLDCALHGYA